MKPGGVREVRLTARGHPAVTGRHDKTLELTAEDAITARGTCILGVAAGPLPGDLPQLRGTVLLTLAAGGRSAAVTGEVNPGYAAAERLVVRRSDRLDPDTYLVGASAAAADLPPELLAALADPAAEVTVTVVETGSPAPVVLVLTPGAAPGSVARLAAQADLVVDLTGRGAAPPAVPLTAPRRHGVPTGRIAARTVVVLTDDLGEPAARTVAAVPGARVALWPPSPGADLLLAAGLPATPLLHAGALPLTPTARRDLATRLAAAAVPTLLTVPDTLLPPRAAKQVAADATLPAATAPLLHEGEHGAADGDLSTATTPLLRNGEQGGPGGRGGASGMTTPLLHEGEQRRTRVAEGGRPAGTGWWDELRAVLPAYRLVVPDAHLGWGVGARVVAPGEPAGDLGGLRYAPWFVLVPPDGPRPVAVDPAELVRLLRAAGRSGRDAAAVLTGLGVPRKDAYRLATGSS